MTGSDNRRASVLVVLDADSTLLQDEVIELLAEEAGSRTEVAEITERAMRGELDFERSLRERVRTLRGLPASVFHHVGERIRVTEGVPELISGVQAAGGVVGVVSGGFQGRQKPLQLGAALGLVVGDVYLVGFHLKLVGVRLAIEVQLQPAIEHRLARVAVILLDDHARIEEDIGPEHLPAIDHHRLAIGVERQEALKPVRER